MERGQRQDHAPMTPAPILLGHGRPCKSCFVRDTGQGHRAPDGLPLSLVSQRSSRMQDKETGSLAPPGGSRAGDHGGLWTVVWPSLDPHSSPHPTLGFVAPSCIQGGSWRPSPAEAAPTVQSGLFSRKPGGTDRLPGRRWYCTCPQCRSGKALRWPVRNIH